MPTGSNHLPTLRLRSALALLVCVSLIWTSHAAYISEIDLGGPHSPAGQGIELSQVDPASDYTLLIMTADATSTAAFGLVLDTIYLPAGSGRGGVAMVTDQPWPGDGTATIPLASTGASNSSLPLNHSRLLVLMQGQSAVRQLDNPASEDPAAAARYDALAVADWLVLGHGDLASDYQNTGHDIAVINTRLGIDLLSRIVDKDGGSVIGRTNAPAQVLEMDTFFVGTPDTARQFEVAGEFLYTYTPGAANLPLTQLPEPGSFAALAILAGLCLRRSRR